MAIAIAQKTIVDLNDPVQQGVAPSSPIVGMLWVDTGVSPPALRSWNGDGWKSLGVCTYSQPTAPVEMTVADVGNIWIDTDDNFKPYRWDGAMWISMRDTHLDAQVSVLEGEIVSKVSSTKWKDDISEIQNDISLVDQKADKISWLVSGGDSVSNMQLTDKTFDLVTENINLHGKVTIGGLDTATQTKVNNGNAAKATVDGWQAPGKTTINGGFIETGSITADKMLIADFNNLAQFDPEAYPAGNLVATINGLVYFKVGPTEWASCEFARSKMVEFKVDNEYQFKFYGFKDAALVGTSITAFIRYFYTDGTWNNAGSAVTLPVQTADNNVPVTGIFKITVAPISGRTISYVRFFIEKSSADTTYFFYVRRLELMRRLKGELIVDGTITADKIETNTLRTKVIENVKVGGQNYALNSAWSADTAGWNLGANVTRDPSINLNGACSVKSEQSGLASNQWRGAGMWLDSFPVTVDDVFTASVWVRVDNANTFDYPVGLELNVYDSSSARINIIGANFTPIAADNGKWKRLVVTHTITQFNAATIGVNFYVIQNGVAWFVCPQLERGDVATDWTPARSEFIGSKITLGDDSMTFRGGTFAFNVSGTNGDMSLDETGLNIAKVISPSVHSNYMGADRITIDKNALDWQVVSGVCFRSLGACLIALSNKHITYDVYIDVVSGNSYYEDFVQLSGVTGSGKIFISGNGAEFPNTDLYLYGVTVYIYISGMRMTKRANSLSCIHATACSYLRVQYCVLTGNTEGADTAGIRVEQGTHAFVSDCEMYGWDWAWISADTSCAYLINNKGDCKGLVAAAMAVMSGFQPCTTSTFNVFSWGSAVFNNGCTVDMGSAAPPVPVTTTTTYAATTSHTVYGGAQWPGSWKSETSEVWQGYTSGMSYQAAMFWFSGLSALAGKVIRSATLTLKRISGIGKGDDVKVVGYYGERALTSSGSPNSRVGMGTLGAINNGETKMFSIPTAAITYLAADVSNHCIALHPGDSVVMSGKVYSSNYAKFSGVGGGYTPQLTVTYEN